MIDNRIGVLGGSFNPVHYGHLRMAVQVLLNLSLDRIDFVPAKLPPHKSHETLLPFSFRLQMLEKCVKNRSFLRVSDLEGRRQGPSYTVDTLREYSARKHSEKLFFIMGLNDLRGVTQWHEWREIFTLADIAVVERAGLDPIVLDQFIAANFSNTVQESGKFTWYVGNKSVNLISMPRLDISSSLLRDMWIRGEELDFLLPDSVLEMLRGNRQLVDSFWNED